MNRREFVAACSLFGISLPFQSFLQACSLDDEAPLEVGNFKGTVLIIGAGAAGMATGYLLEQLRIDYQILEADTSYGGRFRTNNTFTDFPIPLGAEWLHVSRSAMTDMINNPNIEIRTQTTLYQPTDTFGSYSNGELIIAELGAAASSEPDQKFINSSWFDFFESYIVPSIINHMKFNTKIESIDYVNDKVIAKTTDETIYEADKLVLTVPLKLLQLGQIQFTPELPKNKLKAIADANIWSGMKVFLKFSEKFYPTFLAFDDSETRDGQRMYYDVAYGQNSADNVLGLFSVGKQAEQYQSFSGEALKNYILAELDEVFDGKASKTFQGILAQNWNEQPFARAAYLANNASTSISRRMAASVNDKLYFAGCSYTQENDWGSVHTAGRSARDAVRELIR